MKKASLKPHAIPETQESDRLAKIKKYADELSESRLWKIKISYQKRWTKLRRTQKSIQIQGVKPWLQGSGRKRRKPFCPLYERLFQVMRDQSRFIREVKKVMGLVKRGKPVFKTPELCLREGLEITGRFMAINAEFDKVLQWPALCRPIVTQRNNE